MKSEVLYRGAFAMLKVTLDAGERVKAEPGAMVAKSDSIVLESKMEGGILGGLSRKLAGESLFMQSLVAKGESGEVLLAPAYLGEIADIAMTPSAPYLVQKDGFFVGSDDLTISTKTQSLSKGLFSGEGFFILRASGTGTLFVSSYGAIHAIDVPAGKDVLIDNSHLVAWPESMNYTIEKAASGWMSSITTGEGLICRFRGPGRVYLQTRNPRGFARWLIQFLPKPRT
jgi:uncharacterized protein (TIGR00266 family)